MDEEVVDKDKLQDFFNFVLKTRQELKLDTCSTHAARSYDEWLRWGSLERELRKFAEKNGIELVEA